MARQMPEQIRSFLAIPSIRKLAKPSWLVGEIDDDEWIVRLEAHHSPDHIVGATERSLSWHERMPYGLLLSSPELKLLKRHLKLLLISRWRELSKGAPALSVLVGLHRQHILVAENMLFLMRERVEKVGLGALTMAYLEELAVTYSTGGIPATGFWEERLCAYLDAQCFGKAHRTTSLRSLSEYSSDQLSRIVEFIDGRNGINKRGRLTAGFLAQAIGVSLGRVRNRFARPFDRALAILERPQVRDGAACKEDADADGQRIGFRGRNIVVMASSMKLACIADPELAGLPICLVDMEEVGARFKNARAGQTRTRGVEEMVPMINGSLGFATGHGSIIVEELERVSRLASDPKTGHSMHEQKLSLKKFVKGRSWVRLLSRGAEKVRDTITEIGKTMVIREALELFVGSSLFLTLVLACPRVAEVITLQRKHVFLVAGRAYVRVNLRKVYLAHERAYIDKPIPDVLYRILQTNIRVNDLLIRIFGVEDERAKRRVFATFGFNGIRCMTKERGHRYLQMIFAFLMNGLTDNLSDYIRPHQCRRFFAMTFFHAAGGASSLPALSWFMGHRGLRETWRYIKEEMTGREISQLEAELAVQAITSDDLSQHAAKLYQVVAKYFGVERVEVVDPDDLQAYLESLHEEGYFSIVPMNIDGANGMRYQVLTIVTRGDLNAAS